MSRTGLGVLDNWSNYTSDMNSMLTRSHDSSVRRTGLGVLVNWSNYTSDIDSMLTRSHDSSVRRTCCRKYSPENCLTRTCLRGRLWHHCALSTFTRWRHRSFTVNRGVCCLSAVQVMCVPVYLCGRCSYNAVVDGWVDSLWKKVLELHPLAPSLSIIPQTTLWVLYSCAVAVTYAACELLFSVSHWSVE